MAKSLIAFDDRWANGAKQRTDEPPAKVARERGTGPNPAFAVGTNVRLQNLVFATSVNDELSVIQGFDDESLRYAVRVLSTGECARVQEKCMRVSIFGNAAAVLGGSASMG